jgi:imidazolonepropionase-like amidohydrolase
MADFYLTSVTMSFLRYLIPAALAVPSLSAAQDAQITIRTSTMLDGRGGVQENVVIVVAGSRITGVSRSAEPATYDLTSFTVLPGGIDTHNHIAWHFDPDGKIHHLSAEEETPAQAALYAVENAYTTLMGGITTKPWIACGRGSPRLDSARDDSRTADHYVARRHHTEHRNA